MAAKQAGHAGARAGGCTHRPKSITTSSSSGSSECCSSRWRTLGGSRPTSLSTSISAACASSGAAAAAAAAAPFEAAAAVRAAAAAACGKPPPLLLLPLPGCWAPRDTPAANSPAAAGGGTRRCGRPSSSPGPLQVVGTRLGWAVVGGRLADQPTRVPYAGNIDMRMPPAVQGWPLAGASEGALLEVSAPQEHASATQACDWMLKRAMCQHWHFSGLRRSARPAATELDMRSA